MNSLAQALGLGQSPAVLVLAQPVLTSKSYTVAKDGYAVLTGMGGGAGAPMAYMPGNSAPWGIKVIEIKAGDVITFSLGAGGAPGTYTADSATWTGKQGGTTTVALNGAVIMTCQGGDEGPQSSSVPSPVNAVVIGADYWMKGLQPKSSFGGAAVDMGFGSSIFSIASGDCSAAASTSSVAPDDTFAPFGYYFYPFDISVVAQSNLQPGYSGSPFFAGGRSVAVGPDARARPGRGGSGGSSGSQNNVPSGVSGGPGMGYIRLFQKI